MTGPAAGLDRSGEPGDVYVGSGAIAARVRELAATLDGELQHAIDPVLLGVLSGAVAFVADLSRSVTSEHELGFVGVERFSGQAAGSAIRLTLDPGTALAGRDVVVVDDLVDTGLTLHFVLRTLAARRPRTLRAYALLDRPYRRIVDDLPLAHVGFTTADVELVGYGLDLRGRFRELDDLRLLGATRLAA